MKRRAFIGSAAIGAVLSGCLGQSDGNSATTADRSSTTESTTERTTTPTDVATTASNPGDAELNPVWVHDTFTIDIALTDNAVIVPSHRDGAVRAVAKSSESVDWENRVNLVNYNGVTVEDGLVLLQVSQLHVYDEESGEQLWQTDLSGSRIESATATEDHVAIAQLVYGTSDAPLKIRVLDRETGEQVWEVGKSSRVSSTLWSDGEKLYAKIGAGLELYDLVEQEQVGTADDLNVSGLEITEESAYVSSEQGVAKFDKSTLSQEWLYDVEPAQGSPIVTDNHVIAKVQSGLVSLDNPSGKEDWYRRQALSDGAGVHETEDHIWTLSPKRNLVGFEPETGELIARTGQIEQTTDWERDIETDESAIYLVAGSVRRYPVSSLVP